MQITQGTDYAVRIVEVLAQSQQRMDAASVSEKAQVPSRFCLKILRSLVHSGIVTSYKGAKGGYTLARPAEEITLLEVIEAVEGPYRISRCQDSQYQCCHTSCRFHKIYAEITDLVREKLAAHTFSQEGHSEQEE